MALSRGFLTRAGSTEFGGDDRFTVNFGVGYRLIATDWLALHVNVRDHVFESDLLGSDDTYHNLEFSGAFSLFFWSGAGFILWRAGCA